MRVKQSVQGRAFAAALATSLAAGASGTALAAPGVLADAPVFLQKGVQPNILFLIDDSGSMDREMVSNIGLTSNIEGFLDFTPDNTTERLEHCVGYNVLAYDPDPNKVYTPWKGTDVNGNAFADQSPTQAAVNPYTGITSTSCNNSSGDVSNTNGDSCNLVAGFGGSGVYYVPWSDADGDKEYDSGECATGSPVYVSALTAAQQTNYANWFSYYRKREYVVKRAVSEVINESTARVGLATINREAPVTGSGHVGTPVRDVDVFSKTLGSTERKTVEADKNTLLDNLVRINSNGSTPLRNALYRAGRYFEGVDPSALFGYTPALPSDSASGYSPILNAVSGGECQQNFALLFSDGFWNGSFTTTFGNHDEDGAGPYDGQSYADTEPNTLADVAMYFYENDLITTLDNDVPPALLATPAGTTDLDSNPQQHLVTFTVAFGLAGDTACDPSDRSSSVASQGWPEVCNTPGYTGTGSGWPTPTSNTATTVDDMRHAAWNGRGQFLSARDPDALMSQLNAAIADINSRAASTSAAASVAVSSGSMVAGGTVYRAEFNPSSWSGDLQALAFTQAGGFGASSWSALAQLPSPSNRTIITFNGSNGVPFRTPGNYQSPSSTELAHGQIEDLMVNAPHPTATTAAEVTANQGHLAKIVDYLRGDTTKEVRNGGDLRSRRSGVLGDFVNSAPVLVAAPDPFRYPDSIESSSYMAHAASVANRTPVLYAGANDGMLHAFNAKTGAELFAYIPRSVFLDKTGVGLYRLAERSYAHRYYVDLTPAVGEVYTNSQWRTVLVGGLRGGGKGIFALDITNPTATGEYDTEANGAANVLWEFTDNDLGYTFSEITIAKLYNGKWGAIFGNGYNNDPNGDGSAKLFIVDIEDGDLITMIDTKSGPSFSGTLDCGVADCNGLSTPTVVDLDADGVADRAYAGDLKGNVWAFDLTANNKSGWKSAYGSIGSPTPLFTATNGAGTPQPITAAVTVGRHPFLRGANTAPNLVVFFGTGQYLTHADGATTGTQSFYAIWDDGNALASSARSSGGALVEQTITATTAAGADVRTMSDHQVDYLNGDRGWFFDLPLSKERVVVHPVLAGELVIFSTLIPDGSLCGASGESWLMAVDAFNGGEADFVTFDVNRDGLFDSSDVPSSGTNVGGVHEGDIVWQPNAVQSGGHATVFTPEDSGNTGTGPKTGYQQTQIGTNPRLRSSWTRFDF